MHAYKLLMVKFVLWSARVIVTTRRIGSEPRTWIMKDFSNGRIRRRSPTPVSCLFFQRLSECVAPRSSFRSCIKHACRSQSVREPRANGVVQSARYYGRRRLDWQNRSKNFYWIFLEFAIFQKCSTTDRLLIGRVCLLPLEPGTSVCLTNGRGSSAEFLKMTEIRCKPSDRQYSLSTNVQGSQRKRYNVEFLNWKTPKKPIAKQYLFDFFRSERAE